MIFYYEIVPADNRYRGDLLTYHYSKKLVPGQIVEIEVRQKKCLGFVLSQTPNPKFTTKALRGTKQSLILPQTLINLFKSMHAFYPGYLGSIGQLIVPSYLNRNDSVDIGPATLQKASISLPMLNDEQKKAYKKITQDNSRGETYLLHGETGSGKTRLYLELTRSKISAGQSVVILTPEISLTAPLAKQFSDVFGDIVFINHSNLTDKQRFRIWIQAHQAKNPTILIGPRSTIFIPQTKLGLIIIDEFHDQAYKQESPPYYSTIRVVGMLSAISKATCVMGSATPSIADYFIAEQKNIPIIRLLNQAITNQPAKSNFKIVDLTQKDERSKYPLLSNSLLKMVREQVANGKQSMIFINKRGTARSIVCQNCGWRANCINCDLPLAYHDDQHKLRCHTCGYSTTPPQNCPTCQSSDIIFKSPGTKMIAQNLSSIFPNAKIMRFDKDNKKNERMENNYQSLVSGDADIIIGTQLITKGHDLPNLALVAFLQAEAGLDFPDFSSEEKSYQLIKQLLGRVNRGHTPGIVLLQTFDPLNPILKYAAHDSWREFYKSQIAQRQKHGFPPFFHALKIEASRKSRDAAQKALIGLVEKLKIKNNKLQILGPSPSFIEKKAGNYSWQVVVKSKNRSELSDIVKNLQGNYKSNLDPFNFL